MIDQSIPVIRPRETHIYTRKDSIFALLLLVIGYGFCRAFPAPHAPLGTLCCYLLLSLFTFLYLRKYGVKPNKIAAAAGISAAVIGSVLFFSSNAVLHLAASGYLLFAYAYAVSVSGGNALRPGFTNLLPMDLLKAVLLLPFAALGRWFEAVAAGHGMKIHGRAVLKILLGIIFAMVPAAIVVSLLSFDAQFMQMLRSLFQFDISFVIEQVVSVLFGIPVAMYCFGLVTAAREHRGGEALTAEVCGQTSNSMKVFSPLTAVFAVAPVLLLYVIFFISQWDYYVSAFSGVLPMEIERYSTYARDGFFQLCAVSAVNVVMLVVTKAFTKRREQNRQHPAMTVTYVILSLFSLLLIATAMSKLQLYVARFGLTPKRVYAGWLEIVFALFFLLVLLSQFVSKMQLTAWVMGMGIVMFALLGVGNVEGNIAVYNVSHYLDGDLQTVDTDMLMSLGDAAVPALVTLCEAEPARTEVQIYLQQYAAVRHAAWDAVTLPYLLAEHAVSSYMQ